ncbi:hypothetical protein [Gilliamella apicola]|uniref:hypothetical protein n=1 Tax=Gilliamella apicola TaxID=1196095 RepID=UPI002FEE3B0C
MIILQADAMENKYEIRNSSDQLIFSCNDLIEFYSFMETNNNYWFAFTGVSEQNVNLIMNDEIYSIKTDQFAGRFYCQFTVKKIIKSPDVLYACLSLTSRICTEMYSEMYKVGALSFLKEADDLEERVWLDMKGSLKLIYISASYLKNGFPRTLDKETIVIEGKYIQDYYAFFCELGHAFIGKFGYMGSCIDDVSQLIEDLCSKDRKINVIWKDSDLSFKAIDNTLPVNCEMSASDFLLGTLEEYCNVILE